MQKNDIYRIIDANINRACEALRVLEDYSRFTKDNLITTEKLKNIRHKINKLFYPFTNLILYRDSQNDIGEKIVNSSQRTTTKDIIRANSKRAEESLRALSEYGQLLSVNIDELEQMRYEIYTVEKDLIKHERLIRLQNACLYLVAGREALPEHFYDDKTFLSVIEQSIKGGVDIIQLREKNGKESEVLKLAQEIKKLIYNTDILFIINDRLDLALAADADGVHLGQDDLPLDQARKISPTGFLIGLSTHSIEQGKEGINSSADYLGIGPVFQTPTKPNYKVAGLEYVEWANKNSIDKPFFAIGGINETNVDKVINAGASKIAVVRAIMSSENPRQSAEEIKKVISQSQKAYV